MRYEYAKGNRVRIPFRLFFKEALITDKKYTTSRKRQLGEAGDWFYAFDHLFEIVNVCEMPLDKVAEKLWDAEGCDSEKHFINIWKDIYPRRGFVGTDTVWVHEFKRISGYLPRSHKVAKL